MGSLLTIWIKRGKRAPGETVPCRLMDEQHAGLQQALRAHWGGGAFGTVEQGGTIRVGDPVRWSG